MDHAVGAPPRSTRAGGAGERSSEGPPSPRRLRIAIVAEPAIPIPVALYGGEERIADMLVRGLHARGHAVTYFGHPRSEVPGGLVGYGCPPHRGVARAGELAQAWAALWRRRSAFDVVHNFARLATLMPLLRDHRIAKIQRYARPGIAWQRVRTAQSMGGRSLHFTACSTSVYHDLHEQGPGAGRWTTIYNGVELATYRCTARVPPDAPLIFLGRLDPIKGAHDAIEIARRAGRRLVIAGNAPDPAYFRDRIQPHIDGERVAYVGPVNDARKNELLGGAAALLFPIDVEEAFGMVMAEAMACGTPVIAYPRGAVPEVVRPGVNGFVVHSIEEAVQAVQQVPTLPRDRVRADCERRFSAETMVLATETLYRALVDEVAGTRARAA